MKKTHAAQKYKRQLVFLLFVTGKHRYSTKHVTASIGATGAVVSAAATVETVGTYAVASGIGACALSNAGEILTGTNVIRYGLTWRFKRHGRQINLWYLK